MKYRLGFFVLMMSLWSATLVARLVNLQIGQHERYAERAARQQRDTVVDRPLRRAILDARGRPLAISLEVDSAYAHPPELQDPRTSARLVAEIVGSDPEALARRLGRDRDFVWVARQLDPPVSHRLRTLKLTWLNFVPESKRYYPQRELAAPVLGFVGIDDQGLAGLELTYDRRLAGKARRRVMLRTRQGQAVVDRASLTAAPEPGEDLHLTLDAGAQQVAERELARALETGAVAGSAVLLDPRTGAVLALASAPGYDANQFASTPEERRIDRTLAAADPGGLLGTLTMAAALEAAAVTAGTVPPPGAPLPAPGPERLAAFLGRLGFGSGTRTGLPGESSGRLPAAGESGLEATPLQLAAAFAALVNGGRRVSLHLSAGDRPLLDRVVSQEVSHALRERGFAAAAGTGPACALARLESDATAPGGAFAQVGYVPATAPALLGLVTLEDVRRDGIGLAGRTLTAILGEVAVYLRLPAGPAPAVWPGQELGLPAAARK